MLFSAGLSNVRPSSI